MRSRSRTLVSVDQKRQRAAEPDTEAERVAVDERVEIDVTLGSDIAAREGAEHFMAKG